MSPLGGPESFVAVKILDIKRIKEQPRSLENLISEIRVHWLLEKCDGMLGLHEIYEDNEYVFLVLDYQEGGTLLEKIQEKGAFPEFETMLIMEQLLLALDFLH